MREVPQMTHKDDLLDSVDSNIISLLGELHELSASEIHLQYNQRYENKILRAVLWSRLLALVEYGFLEMVTKEDTQLITIFKVKV